MFEPEKMFYEPESPRLDYLSVNKIVVLPFCCNQEQIFGFFIYSECASIPNKAKLSLW